MADLPADSIGARLRKRRTAAGKTLSELAESSGISKSYLWNLENKADHQRPSGDTLYALARTLGTSMSDLLGKKLLVDNNEPQADDVLKAFARKEKLAPAEVRMLASIQWRGDPPRTVERWRFVYDALVLSSPLDEH